MFPLNTWILFSIALCCSVSVSSAVYTDCERPPTILHGKTELTVDDEGVVVIAIYSCDKGFQLAGESEMLCNTDTDEWQSAALPVCKQATSDESSPVAEIEHTEVSPVVTPVEVTHEEISNAIDAVAKTELPATNEIEAESNNDNVPQEPEVESTEAVPQEKRRRKGKHYEEDTSIDVAYASQLDLSCGGKTKISAPNLDNAFISKYNRRRKEDHVFLVAFYECYEYYELENVESNRLYCSKGQWIGPQPVCVRIEGTEGEGEGDEEPSGFDYDSENGDDESGNVEGADNVNRDENQIEQRHDSVPSTTNPPPNENEIVRENVAVDSRSGVDRWIDEAVDDTQDSAGSATQIDSRTSVQIDGQSSVDCTVNNGGCEQNCAVTQNELTGQVVIACSCGEGYALDIDGAHCIEIPSSNADVEIIATNDVGAAPVPTTQPPSLDLSPIKTCGDGFRMDESNNCIDIDECQEGNTGCQYCENLSGSFQCMCPDGFELADDDKTCRDIDECVAYSEFDYDEDRPTTRSICSHECINTQGSFTCKCPADFHLQPDQRTCERDLCQHLGDETKTKCSHECVDEDDGYHCECPEGMDLSHDSKTCVQLIVDQCQNENGGCSDICNWVNDQVVCDCAEGSSLSADGRTCVAANICATNNGGCPQVCNAEENRCECFPGFETNDDGKTCTDINECERSNAGCSQDCRNSDGSFTCACFAGFRAIDEDANQCEDNNECDVDNGNCEHECSNTIGSYVCQCRSGYHNGGDQHRCVDVNECQTNNGNCSHTCVNLPGSHQCTCPQGQFLENDRTCDYKNECEIDNGGCSHGCNFKNGAVNCSCPRGYRLDEATKKSCEDVDECAVQNGGCSHECENLAGRHVCKCNVGFQLGADHGTCIDVDECIGDNGNCSNICVNSPGSYLCACEAGYELADDQHTCRDIDECIGEIHDCSHICINVAGSYDCECPAGYKLSRDHFNCDDINECELEGSCAVAGDCVNTDGSFHCKCAEGHERDPDGFCVDIDECNRNATAACSHTCENVIGAFKCLCPAGMELDSDLVTCVDIDECKWNNGNCSHFCVNIEGSYQCRCPDGYRLDDDKITCLDIDECATENGQCEQRCVNMPGGVKCECDNAAGFRLADDGKKCFNADPCAIKNGGCAHVCEPLNGRAQCYCYKGFDLNLADNSSCVDVNECLANHGCHSKCVNTIGSYKCDCPNGFRLSDDGQCVDIDECAHLNGGCASNAECINFIGSFRCICPAGFKLARDQVTCMEIKDNCAPIPSPEHGDVRCTRSRHRSQLFYRTKCTIWCHEGYTLVGPSVKHCNGTEGSWGDSQTLCVPSSCPPLARAAYGVISPPQCLSSNVRIGENCRIQCPHGFQAVGSDLSICQSGPQWSVDRLECAPIAAPSHTPAPAHSHPPPPAPAPRFYSAVEAKPSRPTKKQITNGETYTQGHIVVEDERNRQVAHPRLHRIQANNAHFRPQINCPRDTTITLPRGQSLVYIKLEQPKTNVNWKTHVDAHPQWAKNLQARLAAGEHRISFRARSPYAPNVHQICRTVITVKSAAAPVAPIAPIAPVAPEVAFCPGIIEVQLRPNEKSRIVHWKEPTFRSHYQLKQLFKTRPSGTQLAAGVHRISYVATDLHNRQARCDFTINVKPATPSSRLVASGPYGSGLANHDSYLLCPSKPAMKLDTSFPVQIPAGCFIKNVRVNAHGNTHRRRHALSSNNNFLKLYSSWNRPENHRFYW